MAIAACDGGSLLKHDVGCVTYETRRQMTCAPAAEVNDVRIGCNSFRIIN